MAQAKKGHLVMENRMGQIARNFPTEVTQFTLIRRGDNGRIEGQTTQALKRFTQRGIPYLELAQVNRTQIMKSPLKLKDGSTIKWISDDDTQVSPQHRLDKENTDQDFIVISKWTFGVGFGLLFIGFVFSLIFPHQDAPQATEVVQIVMPELQKPEVKKEKVQAVKMAEHKIEQHKQKVIPTKSKIKVVKQNQPVHQMKQSFGHTQNQRVAMPGKNINQTGALSAFANKNNAPVTGGSMDIKSIQFKNGSGGGGTGAAGHGGYGAAGRGGMAHALGGRGLVAASLGTGDVGAPSGGYGTRGRAGGQNGYGRANLRGNGDGYFQPLAQAASVEGGLSKDQIDEVIQKNWGKILYCYENALQKKSSLSGRIGLRFVINGSGRVSTASIGSSSLHSREVEGCLVSQLRGFSFPHPVGGVNVKVNYPFEFGRVGQR